MRKYFNSFKRIIQLKSHDQSSSLGVSDERYRRIILSGASTLIVKFVSVAINLITVPLTIHYLGAERYGLWMSISSIMALMNFADLGLGNGLLNAVATANGKSDISSAKVAVSSTFFILSLISLILFFLFIATYSFISWEKIFNVHERLAVKEAGPTMMVLVFTFLINIPLDVIQRIREGYQEGFKSQMWIMAGSLIGFIFLLICIKLKGGLPMLVCSYSSGAIIGLLLNGFFLFNKSHKELFPKVHNFSFDVGKQLIRLGLFFFVLQIFTLLANSSDDIIIAHIFGAKSVAGFEVVKKMFLFSMVTQFVIQPLWPAFAEASANGDIAWVKKTFKKIMVISLVLSCVTAFPLLLFGKHIITFWVGSNFLPSWALLTGFSAFILLANYGGVMSTFLNSNSTLLKQQTLMIGLSAITAVLLKVFLATTIGISGIIWATVIGYSLFYIIPSYKLSIDFFRTKQ